MTTPREKFQALLKKLFQFDNAELDFGIYRIMNHKRAVIEHFIEIDLFKGLDKELKRGALAAEADLARQLSEIAAKIRENFGEDALDAEGNLLKGKDLPLGKEYAQLRQRGADSRSRPELEAEIFNHLYAFFSRYYDDGDFMSLRRYSKRDKYAIPYNGEEVHFHWANADQYYIKTGENFTDYKYRHSSWTVQFKLRHANVEQNNVQGAKRFFIPRADEVVIDVKARILSVLFEYRPLSGDEEVRYGKGSTEEGNEKSEKPKAKKKGQDGILADAAATIMAKAKNIPDVLAALVQEKRKDSYGEPVGLLDHHLRAYTRTNTTDFFIHKDLKGFLERELDFYLKNEVLNVDEVEAAGELRSENWFQTLRTLKAIGCQIIAFVAQIEDFQKKLFEKRKFITEVNYCVTLDRIPEDLYPEIAKNKSQIAEWKRLFHIHEVQGDTDVQRFREPVRVDFLKTQPSLMLDTRFFSMDFKDRLLEGLSRSSAVDLEQEWDGVLVHSENFQAINLLARRYENAVQCIYIDPPYNTDAGPILYKNGYRSSTWVTMLENRLVSAARLLKNTGVLCVTIDDYQVHELAFLLDKLFGRINQLGTAVIRNNPSGRSTVEGISISHEYAFFYRRTEAAKLARLPRSEKQLQRFSTEDGIHVDWRNFRKDGGLVTHRAARPKQFYPIYVNPEAKSFWIPELSWNENKKEWNVLEKPAKDEVAVWPIDERQKDRVWSLNHISAKEQKGDLEVRSGKKGDIQMYRRHIPSEGVLPRSLWDKKTYAAREYGSAALGDLFGDSSVFSFAKSPFAVQDCIWVGGLDENEPALVFDFFAGSGTTGHAVVAMNRDDDGERRYVLAEVGQYFDTVLKPRLQKVIYSKDWHEGKPVSRQGSSHAFKYLRLESYEDALDNIAFESGGSQGMLQLDDYVLGYMLNFETKSSDTFLNVANLDAPFEYKLRRHGQDEPLAVDLPETFNYLIGLHVATRRIYDNKGVRYLVYRGKADGREMTAIWRTTRGWGKDEFEADREFVKRNELTDGMEEVYVNADSFIEGALSLDPVFKRLMFGND